MTAIQQQLNEKIAKLPFYTNGKLDQELLSDSCRKNTHLYNDIFVNDSRNKRNYAARTVIRSVVTDLVVNRLESIRVKEDCDLLLQLNHDNIEKILYNGYTQDFFIWITPLFVTKLKTVWVRVEQFRVYNVKQMFLDLLKGLEYMKSKNVASGVIHEDNLAYNGESWYISGIINSNKEGESMSGCYISSSLKSRRCMISNRFNTLEKEYIPEDDLWQLILMYVITYYGFNPFNSTNTIFSPQKGTLHDASKLHMEISAGKCQNITLSTTPDRFGIILKHLLISISLNRVSYDLFRYIVENNGTNQTEGLDALVSEEITVGLESNLATLQLETVEPTYYQTRVKEEENISVNIDQYITKYKECECIVCFSNTIKYRFLKCKHEVCCNTCYVQLNKKCPMCRAPIESTEELSIDYIEKLNEERKNMYFEIKSF